jgi:microcystin-dependent protein
MWVPYNFAPKGWAFCNGQILPIAQNTALFSLLGTTYGGNGTSNFALPDMQGRVQINAGQGAGLSNYDLGQSGGEETHTLLESEMPMHTHQIQVDANVATQTTPSGNILAQSATGKLYGNTATATMAPGALVPQGSGLPHNNMMPYTTLNCIIALQGIFPARP